MGVDMPAVCIGPYFPRRYLSRNW